MCERLIFCLSCTGLDSHQLNTRIATTAKPESRAGELKDKEAYVCVAWFLSLGGEDMGEAVARLKNDEWIRHRFLTRPHDIGGMTCRATLSAVKVLHLLQLATCASPASTLPMDLVAP